MIAVHIGAAVLGSLALRRRAKLQPAAKARDLLVTCRTCHVALGKARFSNSQWKRRTKSGSRCNSCLDPASGGAAAARAVHESAWLAAAAGALTTTAHVARVAADIAEENNTVHGSGGGWPAAAAPSGAAAAPAAGDGDPFLGGVVLARGLDCPGGPEGRYWGKGTTRKGGLRPGNWGYSQHVDALWGMNCYPEIVRLRIFPGAKDVSESMGALRAATLYCASLPMAAGKGAREGSGEACVAHGGATDCWRRHGFRSRWRAEGVWCVAIGDGCTPRTAALCSYLTQWDEIISVDPELQEGFCGTEPHGIRGLTGARACFEEWLPAFAASEHGARARATCRHLVVLCVHSHHRFAGAAAFEKVRAAFGTPPTCLVALPCCPTFRPTKDVGRTPDLTFDDPAVFSACRSIDVWNWE